MHDTLRILIDEFRTAQDVGVRVLTEDLKIPLPRSGRDWHDYCASHGLFQMRLIDDVGFYAHGYGIELKIKSLTIDFDWGDDGQPDGFDVWRLYNFARQNLTSVSATSAEIDVWIAASVENQELVKEGFMYYDPMRRAISPPSRPVAVE